MTIRVPVFSGGACGMAGRGSISQKVLLLLPRVCVNMGEIGAKEMRMVLIKNSMIPANKRKTDDLSGGCKNA